MFNMPFITKFLVTTSSLSRGVLRFPRATGRGPGRTTRWAGGSIPNKTRRHGCELIVPRGKRRHGYYVLPFQLGESLVARVDLTADRDQGSLLILGAHLEPGREPGSVTRPLAAEVNRMASWLGAERGEPSDKGDLATELQEALR